MARPRNTGSKRRVRISNVAFSGLDGDLVDGFCPNCGKTKLVMPLAGDTNFQLQETTVECANCGAAVTLSNGEYDGKDKVFHSFAQHRPTRQQARRFAHAVKKFKDFNSLRIKSRLIGPQFEVAVEEAGKTRNPRRFLHAAAAIALFFAGVASGINDSDEVYQKYVRGELYSAHAAPAAGPDEQSKDTPSSGAEENAQTKLPDETKDITENKNTNQPKDQWPPLTDI
ncbi:hypothetical protein KM176_05540 [Pseudooceanicola sp. CBS1P-1]|uniref:Uncharacterized protein n=1 Tax=Pseudooceanicola albus TaxID=2692189 RepID=A0A6L7FY59_9RHOB|nr:MULTISPECIES: hypothetical protein [Pseudooceanicola]MBT9383315.1 hypothetical protein [Pseudooceanicola endophyticus]MXN16362.1 hypothetical protein [Pseudooceanicola albus]